MLRFGPATMQIRRYIRRISKVCATVCLFLLLAQTLESQQPQYPIKRIDIVGLRIIQRKMIQPLIFSRPGQPYNAEAVERDADVLRDTGYFDQVRLTVEDSPKPPYGKTVIFNVIKRLTGNPEVSAIGR